MKHAQRYRRRAGSLQSDDDAATDAPMSKPLRKKPKKTETVPVGRTGGRQSG